jgi:hypothetical protein
MRCEATARLLFSRRLALLLLAGAAAGGSSAAMGQHPRESPESSGQQAIKAEQRWDIARPAFYDDSIPREFRSALEYIWYPRSLQDQADGIWREVLRLRDAGRQEEARRIALALGEIVHQAKHRLLPRPDGKAELHVVSVDEGAHASRESSGEEGVAEVHVRFAGQPIVLALSAREPVKWRVRSDRGVRLQEVVIAGYSPQTVEGLPAGVAVRDIRLELRPFPVHAYRASQEPQYSRMMGHLREATGLDAATFLGSRRYSGSPIVIGGDNQDWRVQLVSSRIAPLHRTASRYQRAERRQRMQSPRFHAVYFSAEAAEGGKPQRVLAEFTPLGPIVTTFQPLPDGVDRVAVDADRSAVYASRKNEVVKLDFPGNGANRKLRTGRIFSSPLALDTKRHRLLVNTWRLPWQDRDCRMHFIDVTQDDWTLDFGVECPLLLSLGYSEQDDVFYAESPLHFASDDSRRTYLRALQRISPSGERLRPLRLDEPIPVNATAFDGRFQVVCAGRYVIVLAPLDAERDGRRGPERCGCYVIDPTNGLVVRKSCVRPQAGLREFREGELARLWQHLSASRGEQADLLMWKMASGGKQTVEFLRDRILTLKAPSRKRIVELIEQLDDDRFRVRDAAYLELALMGRFPAAELARTARNPLSREQAFRISRLLAAIESGSESAIHRAMQILLRNRSPQAIDLLTQLTRRDSAPELSRLAEQMLRQIDDEDEDGDALR